MATSSSGADTTPDVTVSNLTAGDLVRVYSDSSCGIEAAGAVLAQGTTSVTITVSELSGTGSIRFTPKRLIWQGMALLVASPPPPTPWSERTDGRLRVQDCLP